MDSELEQYLQEIHVLGAQSKAEKVLMWIPFLGWFVGACLWNARMRPTVQGVSSVLTNRTRPSVSVWGEDLQRQAVGLRLSKLAREEMGWPNDHFLPDDPAGVVFWSHEDGLDYEEALGFIEEDLGAVFSEAEAAALLDGTLGNMVDAVLAKSLATSS